MRAWLRYSRFLLWRVCFSARGGTGDLGLSLGLSSAVLAASSLAWRRVRLELGEAPGALSQGLLCRDRAQPGHFSAPWGSFTAAAQPQLGLTLGADCLEHPWEMRGSA